MAEVIGEIPPPFAVAMVLCEAIWRDPATGKRALLGCFSTIGAHTFPATHPMVAVYTALTNGRGKEPFRLRLIDADEEREPIFSIEGEVEFEDPRVVLELDVVAGMVTFPEAGKYRVQLFVREQFILERRLILVPIPQAGNNE